MAKKKTKQTTTSITDAFNAHKNAEPPKDTNENFRVNKELKDKFSKVLKAKGETKTDFLTFCIKKYVEENAHLL